MGIAEGSLNCLFIFSYYTLSNTHTHTGIDVKIQSWPCVSLYITNTCGLRLEVNPV